jgi:hypothetical protein
MHQSGVASLFEVVHDATHAFDAPPIAMRRERQEDSGFNGRRNEPYDSQRF